MQKEQLYLLNRDLFQKEIPALPRDIMCFLEKVYAYYGPTYGCCSPNETAVTLEPNKTPFFGVPTDALSKEVNKVHVPFNLHKYKVGTVVRAIDLSQYGHISGFFVNVLNELTIKVTWMTGEEYAVHSTLIELVE
jgi:hypothetical protein